LKTETEEELILIIEREEETYKMCIGYLQLLYIQSKSDEWSWYFGDFILHAREHFRWIV